MNTPIDQVLELRGGYRISRWALVVSVAAVVIGVGLIIAHATTAAIVVGVVLLIAGATLVACTLQGRGRTQ